MIVSCVVGGLGNQLFQYAMGRCLAQRNDVELCVDYGLFAYHTMREPLLSRFQVRCREVADPDLPFVLCLPDSKSALWRRARRRLGRQFFPRHTLSTLREQTSRFDASFLDLRGHYRLMGFWQSEKYFQEIAPQIRRELQIKPEFLPHIAPMSERIAASNAISIHFRRTDFVGQERFEMRNPLDYYRAAVDDIAQHVENPTFYLFSDDIAWVKAHFQTVHRVVYANENGTLSDVEELHLMSSCRHHIIANSTFSWWGAWLNDDAQKRVYAPRTWMYDDLDYTDMVPENWIRL